MSHKLTLDDLDRQHCYRPLTQLVRAGKVWLLVQGGGHDVLRARTEKIKAGGLPFVAILQARDQSTAAFPGVTALLDLAHHVLVTETDAFLGYADAARRAEAGKSTVIIETWMDALGVTLGWVEYVTTVFPDLPIDGQLYPQHDEGEA